MAVKVRSGRPRDGNGGSPEPMPPLLRWGVLAAAGFYLVAHLSIVQGVWPVHGVAGGAGAILLRDLVALAAWLLLIWGMHLLRYRGSWALIALPVAIFFFTRPALFQLFTDPAYQAAAGTRAEANFLKAERSQLSTILRTYDGERQQIVFDGAPPPLPDPMEAVRTATAPERASWTRLGSSASVMIAPVALLIAFAWALNGQPDNSTRAVTVAFMALALAQIFHLGNARSSAPVLTVRRIMANRWAIGAVVLTVGLQLLALNFAPLAGLLGVAPLPSSDWLVVVLLALVPAVMGQMIALVRSRQSTD